jgi:hypothetical protein
MKISRKQLRSLIIEQLSPSNQAPGQRTAGKADAVTYRDGPFSDIRNDPRAREMVNAGLTTFPGLHEALRAALERRKARGGGSPGKQARNQAIRNAADEVLGSGWDDDVETMIFFSVAAYAGHVAGIASGVSSAPLDALEILTRNKKSTASFALDVIKRSMSRSFKRNKKDMENFRQEMASKALKSNDIKRLGVALKSDLLKINVNDLYDVYENMKKSASAEYVDLEAVEKTLEEIKAKIR